MVTVPLLVCDIYRFSYSLLNTDHKTNLYLKKQRGTKVLQRNHCGKKTLKHGERHHNLTRYLQAYKQNLGTAQRHFYCFTDLFIDAKTRKKTLRSICFFSLTDKALLPWL